MEEREDVVMENRRERSEKKRRCAEGAWKNRRERRCGNPYLYTKSTNIS
jgi:hypothetical protein